MVHKGKGGEGVIFISLFSFSKRHKKVLHSGGEDEVKIIEAVYVANNAVEATVTNVVDNHWVEGAHHLAQLPNRLSSRWSKIVHQKM
ncbi:hypothetical protein POVWA2_044550 [Plasmodium ovale wallikeri]|uniref:Uncharacterized protein n=1 Tax=Plasmodium ovale wallikeri TaxID=864142 RepID=A0A1A8ZF31_PLAOA|nr:hypothetical protein POVWA1_045980 [Plasmodium ovale wallikeri]SBT42760.1 hypothetical protein POVWA2_044550 [Plasmodium ovale wallikeri]